MMRRFAPAGPNPGGRLAVSFLTALVLVASLISFAAPAQAAAADTLTIKDLQISVQPEYDDPRVLVTYTGEFTGSFPREVKFSVPKNIEINMTCALRGSDHLCQQYTVTDQGDWQSLAFTLPIPTFYLEYYWEGAAGRPERQLAYDFKAPYAVDNLQIEVQQPLRSTAFKMSPAENSVASDNQGFKYYRYNFSKVPADKLINIAGSYAKSDDNPSVKKTVGTGAGSQPGETSKTTSILLAVVGGMIVLAVGYLIFRPKRRLARAPARGPAGPAPRAGVNRPPIRPSAVQEKPASARGSFCSSCGARLEPGDKFCTGCGAQARKAG